MHSAVTHHSQWSGFFSPASDVVRAVWEEVHVGGASTRTTVCPGVLRLHSCGGGGLQHPSLRLRLRLDHGLYWQQRVP